MATTRQIVEWVKLSANGWNVDGPRGILPILNEVQNLMLEEQTAQTVIYDSSTGIFPTFDTTDGQFEYEIDDVWRITDVLIKYENSTNYNLRTWYGDYSEDDIRNQVVEYQSKKYLRVKDCQTRESTISEPAKIIFANDPGDTADYFLYRGYYRPNQLISVSVQMTIPEKYHLIYVVPAVIEFIKCWQTGGWDKAIETITKKYVLPVRIEMNKGHQGGVKNTITQRNF